jgi:hypothetical protein
MYDDPENWPRRPRRSARQASIDIRSCRPNCVNSCCSTDADLANAFRLVLIEVEAGTVQDLAPFLELVGRQTGANTSARLGRDYDDSVTASEMPDECHDHCQDQTVYWPFRWTRGLAQYQCAAGHSWSCGWGHGASGGAPENRGQPR